MRGAVGLVCLLFLLAGCSEETPSAPADLPETSTSPQSEGNATAASNVTTEQATPADDIIAQRTQCKQLHGIYPTTDKDWGLPEGWTVGTGDGFGPAIYVYPTICAEDSSAWVMLGVTPPDGLQDPTVDIEYWVLSVGASNETYRQFLDAAGYPVDSVDVSLTETGNSDFWVFNAGDGSYSLQAAYALGNSDVAGQFTHRAWTLDASGTPIALRMVTFEFSDLGTGLATFTSSGDPGTPLAATGLGHRITDASYDVRWDRHTLQT